jgi:hypothetical protein
MRFNQTTLLNIALIVIFGLALTQHIRECIPS